jgi:hypothetical protein
MRSSAGRRTATFRTGGSEGAIEGDSFVEALIAAAQTTGED